MNKYGIINSKIVVKGTSTKAKYTKEFHRSGACMNPVDNEPHLIARFVGGLRADIKEKVQLQPLGFHTHVISFTRIIEEMNETRYKNLYNR